MTDRLAAFPRREIEFGSRHDPMKARLAILFPEAWRRANETGRSEGFAIWQNIIETTENGTGYRAFDPPHPKPNYAAWLILILMIGGGIWSALT